MVCIIWICDFLGTCNTHHIIHSINLPVEHKFVVLFVLLIDWILLFTLLFSIMMSNMILNRSFHKEHPKLMSKSFIVRFLIILEFFCVLYQLAKLVYTNIISVSIHTWMVFTKKLFNCWELKVENIRILFKLVCSSYTLPG